MAAATAATAAIAAAAAPSVGRLPAVRKAGTRGCGAGGSDVITTGSSRRAPPGGWLPPAKSGGSSGGPDVWYGGSRRLKRAGDGRGGRVRCAQDVAYAGTRGPAGFSTLANLLHAGDARQVRIV